MCELFFRPHTERHALIALISTVEVLSLKGTVPLKNAATHSAHSLKSRITHPQTSYTYLYLVLNQISFRATHDYNLHIRGMGGTARSPPGYCRSMEEEYRTRLHFHREAIVEDLNVAEISDYLISKSVITDDDRERIDAETTRRDRVREFLRILLRRGQNAFDYFVESLKKEYEHLWKLLSRPLDDEQPDEGEVRETRG